MTLPKRYKVAIAEWAKNDPLIQSVYVYGSYAKGVARPDSDLDVAVKLSSPDDVVYADFIFEAERWKAELQAKIDVPVDLDLCHPEEAPHVWEYLKEASILVYERG